MKKILALCSSLVLALTFLVGIAQSPVAAVGTCPDSLVYVESQAWWAPNPGTTGGKDFGHVHFQACIPERDVITAPMTIPISVTLHHNPGTLRDLSVVAKTTNSEVTYAKIVPPRRTCPVTETCVINMNAVIDPSKFDRAGLQEIRFRVFVNEPDGKEMHTSVNWQTYIENGKTRSNVTRMPWFRSKGWYTGYGYCSPDYLSVPLPDNPVSGNWTVRLQQIDQGSSDVNPSHHTVAIDSNAHENNPGIVLKSAPGPLVATTFTFDTTTLANGVHRLVQRTDCASGNQINSGVQVVQFVVDNPVPTPEPTPEPTIEPTVEPTPPTCGG